MSKFRNIQQKINDGVFTFTEHCLDESMPDDNLEPEDIVNAILKGYLSETLTDDSRGTRYLIVGEAEDGRLIEIVCRLHETEGVMIITVYEVEEE